MTKEISLTQGYSALVDDADFGWLSQNKWYAVESSIDEPALRVCAARCGYINPILMHREIMGAPKGMVVHHKNQNTLDNRRNNLVVLTYRQHRQIHADIQRETGEAHIPERARNMGKKLMVSFGDEILEINRLAKEAGVPIREMILVLVREALARRKAAEAA